MKLVVPCGVIRWVLGEALAAAALNVVCPLTVDVGSGVALPFSRTRVG